LRRRHCISAEYVNNFSVICDRYSVPAIGRCPFLNIKNLNNFRHTNLLLRNIISHLYGICKDTQFPKGARRSESTQGDFQHFVHGFHKHKLHILFDFFGDIFKVFFIFQRDNDGF